MPGGCRQADGQEVPPTHRPEELQVQLVVLQHLPRVAIGPTTHLPHRRREKSGPVPGIVPPEDGHRVHDGLALRDVPRVVRQHVLLEHPLLIGNVEVADRHLFGGDEAREVVQ